MAVILFLGYDYGDWKLCVSLNPQFLPTAVSNMDTSPRASRAPFSTLQPSFNLCATNLKKEITNLRRNRMIQQVVPLYFMLVTSTWRWEGGDFIWS